MAERSAGLAAGLDDDYPMKVVVRFNASQSYTLDVKLTDSIRDIKEKLALKTQTPVNSINLVLAGQLMNNTHLIEDYGVGAHTTLHAFCWSDDGPAVSATETKSSTSELSNEREHLALPDNHNQHASFSNDHETHDDCAATGLQRFFVFCKLCDCVRPGRLRVQCRACGSGAFLVNRGPSNWVDISPDSQIRGECKSCGGDRPMFYMRCSQGHSESQDGTAVVLKHVQANRRRVECIICADVMSHILIFPCPPGHVICLDCFRQYGSSCLSERRFVEHPVHGYTLPCPAGCPDAYVEESHHFLMMGKEKYERYKNFAAEEYVLHNGGLLCPGPGCGMGLFPDEDLRSIYCQECRFNSCRQCQREYHPGDCQEYLQSQTFNANNMAVSEARAERASWEQQSLSLIDETTKACPGCHTKTEKSGGCMHMVCSRCGKEWCWLCVKDWTRDCQADHWFGV